MFRRRRLSCTASSPPRQADATPAAARLKELEKLPGAKANDVDTLRELGRAYLAAGQPAPAKKALETAQGLRPADREPPVHRSADLARLAGIAAVRHACGGSP